MFIWITCVGLLLTFAIVGAHLLLSSGRREPAAGDAPVAPAGGWTGLLYLLLMACGLGLAVTGLLTAGLRGRPMTGFWLMLHVMLGSALIWALLGLALGWAEMIWRGRDRHGRRLRPLQGFLFWLLLGLGLWSGMTAMVSMTMLTGTDGQHLLYELHRYGSLAWVMAAIGHGYLMWRDSRGRASQQDAAADLGQTRLTE